MLKKYALLSLCYTFGGGVKRSVLRAKCSIVQKVTSSVKSIVGKFSLSA